VVGIACVTGDDELMLITQQGQILRIGTNEVRVIGRATQGVRLIGVDEGDRVVSIVRLLAEQNGDGENGNGNGGENGEKVNAGVEGEVQASADDALAAPDASVDGDGDDPEGGEPPAEE
jgi:DNA gyrase/topoisomerase IV subunit A